jgi:hypothetical protein
MEQETQESQAPELTITDLTNLKSIIEVAVKRGAFDASEIAAVGSTFNRLNKFLNEIKQQKDLTENQG